jgi:ABC-type sugar transport system ATPase subunit
MTMADRIVVMKDGRVQQIGAPLDVYERPANTFVAGFIGSPAMNLLPGYRDPQGRLTTAGFLVDEPTGGVVGHSVTVGVRPEDIRASAADCIRPLSIAAKLRHVEHLGSETLLHLEMDRLTLQARVSTRWRSSPGDLVELFIDQDCLHIFNGDTGQRLAA